MHALLYFISSVLLLPPLHSARVQFLKNLSLNTQNLTTTSKNDVGFIIVPGYRSNAHHFLLGQIDNANVGLVNCIDICGSNEKCQAITFQVGKCLLYGKDGLDGTSKSTSFSFYGQKIFLPKVSTLCTAPWNLEVLPNFRLSEMAKRVLNNATLSQCLRQCIAERGFKCKSVNFNAQTSHCELLEVDRNSLEKVENLEESEGYDYFENSCMAEPRKLCDIKKINGRKLVAVDDLFASVENKTTCEKLCLNANYRCHYYEYSGKSKICRLSHLSQKTATALENPYTQVSRKRSGYEINICYDVKIECSKDGILTKVDSSQLFNGVFYSYGSAHSCFSNGTDSYDFQLNMAYTDLSCNMSRHTEDSYEAKLFIQQHRNFVTSSDKSLSVSCKYQVQNLTIHNDVDVNDRLVGPSVHLSEYLKAPPIRMSVVRRKAENQSIHDIQVGDALSIKVEFLSEDPAYDLFVRHLIATDSANIYELELIDLDGCPEEVDIMSAAYRKKNDAKKLMLDFEAFKFPSSDLVRFRAVISLCLNDCKPSKCKRKWDKNEQLSYGKKRKRRSDDSIESQIVHDIVFTETIQVFDKLVNEKQRQHKDLFNYGSVNENDSFLTTKFCFQGHGILITTMFFLVGQIISISVFETIVYMDRRKNRQVR